MRSRIVSHALLTALIAGSAGGCSRLPGHREPPPVQFWLLPAPGDASGHLSAPDASSAEHAVGAQLVLDSLSLRPSFHPGSQLPSLITGGSPRLAVVTTYQGSRYHPETLRSLVNDSVVMQAAAGEILRASSSTGASLLVIDIQGLTPGDVNSIVALTRAMRDSAQRYAPAGIALVVPPSDTAGYPTAILARVAERLVIRLYGEHRQGTAPGPLASSDWIARQIGLRTVAIGVNRLVAELPLFGYLWDERGTVRIITFADAQRLVASESGSFRRDPASKFLTASGRDGWTVWIPDGVTIETLIAAVRAKGVSTIALSGSSDAAPDIRLRFYGLKRRFRKI